MLDNKFHWISSIDKANFAELNELDRKMSIFYSEINSRLAYNDMIKGEEITEKSDPVTTSFLKWFKVIEHTNILEVGCGTGRIWRRLCENDNFQYTGTEVSKETILENQLKWPKAKWVNKSVYDLEIDNNQYDLVFSFYVLEHLVFPMKALEIMLNLVKPGGYLAILCPDFVASGRIPSQCLGLSYLQSASEKFNDKRYLDALISLYDSKIRLPKALKNVHNSTGKFFINKNPICLSIDKSVKIWPDCDAVYLSNKKELAEWGFSKNLQVSYPAGTENIFSDHCFLVFKK